jgi:hypothetical protein
MSDDSSPDLSIGITIARVYSTATNQEHFSHLIDAFHTSIQAATGQSLRLQMIHGEGPTAYLFDAEAAQALGPANAVRRLPGFDATKFRTDLDILASVLLTCRVHFFQCVIYLTSCIFPNAVMLRGITRLGNAVNQKESRCLESICYMYTEEEVTQWRNFCSTHKESRVRSKLRTTTKYIC